MLRIGMVSRNKISARPGSGVNYYMAKALERYVGEVELIDGLKPDKLSVNTLCTQKGYYIRYVILRFRQIFWKLLGKNYRWEHTTLLSKYLGKSINKALQGKKWDLLFAEKGSSEIAYLNTDIPVIYGSDATFRLLIDFYPAFSTLASSSVREGNEIERRAIHNAKVCIYRSKWAANSAIKDFWAPTYKVVVGYCGPCIDPALIPTRQEIVDKERPERCSLLLMGTDWRRKGCDIAVETVEKITSMGINAHLTICGCVPPDGLPLSERVTVIPFLDKNKPEDMKKIASLYREGTYFIFPTRAEALGIALIEACAFGLPMCGTDIGGTSEIIKDQENGFIFSLHDSPEEYARRIASGLKDPAGYKKMCISAYDFYRKHLDWKCWANRFVGIIPLALGP